MRERLKLIIERDPTLEVEGEIRADMALSQPYPRQRVPQLGLHANANLLIMPNIDAANIAFNLLRIASGSASTVGAFCSGAARPVHILGSSATVRRIVDMTAFVVAEASAPLLQAVPAHQVEAVRA